MAGKGNSPGVTELSNYQIQTSQYNVPLAIGWGSFRASSNIIDCVDFTAHKQSSGGGKGGGGKGASGYTYTGSILLAILLGPISGIRTVWRDKDIFTDAPGGSAIQNAIANGGATVQALSALGLSYALGARGQAAWGYLTSNYPTHAIGYSDLTYAYAANYSLGSNGSISNHSFEVQCHQATVSGALVDDALPAFFVADCLTSSVYGLPLWPSGSIASLTLYGNYCLAQGLLLSPYENQQRTYSEFLTEIMKATNSDAVWSDGLLKIGPYGDETITGNGATWTPSLNPVYDLNDDDFVVSQGEDPVQISYKRPEEAYNDMTLQFNDRANFYNANTATARDQANINQYGRVRQTAPDQIQSIALASTAQTICQLLMQRACYVQATYSFKLPPYFGLLEPQIDTVTLTSSGPSGILNQKLVRITSMERDKDKVWSIGAEEVVLGTASVATSTTTILGMTVINTGHAPPVVAAPVLFNAPTSLTGGANEIWAALAGSVPATWGGAVLWISTDGGTDYQIAVDDTGAPLMLSGPSRYGTLTTNLASGASSLAIDVTLSGAIFDSVSAGQAATFQPSLCWVDGELLAYTTATLTGLNAYTLSGLYRGLYGTPNGSHASGAPFARLDGQTIRYAYPDNLIGSTIYVKFQSFNLFGHQSEDLSACTPYTIFLSPYGTPGSNTTNRVPFSKFEAGPTGDWSTGTNSASLAITATVTTLGGAQTRTQSATATAAGQVISQKGSPFAVTVDERLAIQGLIAATNASAHLAIGFLNSSGGVISVTQIGATITSSTATEVDGFITVPAGAVEGWVESFATSTASGAMSSTLAWPMVSGSQPGQSLFPAFTPGPNASDGATVGGGGDSNRIQFSLFEKGTGGWTLGVSSIASPTFGIFSSGGYVYGQFQGTATFPGQSVFIASNPYPVVAGEELAVSAIVNSAGSQGQLDINWFNSTGGFISQSSAVTGTFIGATTTAGTVTVPAGAVSAILFGQVFSLAAGFVQMFMAQPMVCGIAPGQTIIPNFSPGPNAVDAADVTASNTAAAIAGQGALATLSSAAYGSIYLTGFGSLAGLGSVDPSTSEVLATGSIPPALPDLGFGYTSTTSAIDLTWPTITIYRADGTTLTVTSGSQNVTGLTPSTIFKFYPYVVDGGGTTGTMSFATGSTGAVGSPAIMYPSGGSVQAAAIMYGRGHIVILGFLPSTTSSGGGGGGGGGGGCLHPLMTVGGMMADHLRAGDLIETPAGRTPILSIERRECSEWIVVAGNGEPLATVTGDHLFYLASGAEVRARNLRLGDILRARGDHIEVTGLILDRALASMVAIHIAEPHLHYAGKADLLCHNGNPKP